MTKEDVSDCPEHVLKWTRKTFMNHPDIISDSSGYWYDNEHGPEPGRESVSQPLD